MDHIFASASGPITERGGEREQQDDDDVYCMAADTKLPFDAALDIVLSSLKRK